MFLGAKGLRHELTVAFGLVLVAFCRGYAYRQYADHAATAKAAVRPAGSVQVLCPADRLRHLARAGG